MNAELAAQYDDIDSILTRTLDFDDFFDLEELRVAVEHPPFPRPDLVDPLPAPPQILAPPEPVFMAPPPVTGLFSKKKNLQAEAAARARHEEAYARWQAQVSAIPARQFEQIQQHQRAEASRQAELTQLQAQYRAESEAREREASERNSSVDEFSARLAASDRGAVEEYIGLVFARSVYPDTFPVSHDFEYSPAGAELTVTVSVPTPEQIPTVKEHKYNKTKDEITATALPQKDQKARYASAICQVAVRTLHEVFEADREDRVRTIAFTLSTDAVDDGTGLPVRVPLIAAAASRDVFTAFDLANVVPAATLEHLNALVSKNPHGLVPIATGPGVRS